MREVPSKRRLPTRKEKRDRQKTGPVSRMVAGWNFRRLTLQNSVRKRSQRSAAEYLIEINRSELLRMKNRTPDRHTQRHYKSLCLTLAFPSDQPCCNTEDIESRQLSVSPNVLTGRRQGSTRPENCYRMATATNSPASADSVTATSTLWPPQIL